MKQEEYQFFIDHADEKIQQIASLRRKIGGLLLDIGTGEGTIIKSLKPMFEMVEAIDEKKEFCDKLTKEGIICHNVKFEDFQTNTRYDVILASHLLTYVSDKKKVIEKMYELLKVGGKIYIFNMTYDGTMQIIKEQIHPKICDRTDIQIQEIIKSYSKYEREIIPINMETKTSEDMLKMVHFLSEKRPILWEKNKSKVENLILNTAKVGSGFTLSYYNVLYTIYK